MHTIVASSPLEGPLSITLANGRKVELVDRQIVLWISITPTTVIGLKSSTPRLPAVLDTGFNSTLAISEKQLKELADLDVSQLREFPEDVAGLPAVKGVRVPTYEAAVWLHSNLEGQRDELRRNPPYWTNPHPGILILPPEIAPRLPLLGLRWLEQCGMQVTLDPLPTKDGQRYSLHCTIRSLLPPLP